MKIRTGASLPAFAKPIDPHARRSSYRGRWQQSCRKCPWCAKSRRWRNGDCRPLPAIRCKPASRPYIDELAEMQKPGGFGHAEINDAI